MKLKCWRICQYDSERASVQWLETVGHLAMIPMNNNRLESVVLEYINQHIPAERIISITTSYHDYLIWFRSEE